MKKKFDNEEINDIQCPLTGDNQKENITGHLPLLSSVHTATSVFLSTTIIHVSNGLKDLQLEIWTHTISLMQLQQHYVQYVLINVIVSLHHHIIATCLFLVHSVTRSTISYNNIVSIHD